LDRKVDMACIQETQWKGSGCKFYGAKGKRYKLLWMGGEERQHGVGILVAEKWVTVLLVSKCTVRLLILKMVSDNGFSRGLKIKNWSHGMTMPLTGMACRP